jgi:hypothetical protein
MDVDHANQFSVGYIDNKVEYLYLGESSDDETNGGKHVFACFSDWSGALVYKVLYWNRQALEATRQTKRQRERETSTGGLTFITYRVNNTCYVSCHITVGTRHRLICDLR